MVGLRGGRGWVLTFGRADGVNGRVDLSIHVVMIAAMQLQIPEARCRH